MASVPKPETILVHIAYFFAGVGVLVLLSTVQKAIIGAPFTLDGFIVPALYGGVTGAVIGVWAERLRRQNRLLIQHIAERQYLLRDLHHRIQNNLQVVSSLLTLDEGYQIGVEESRRRIDLMAVLHRVLYDIEADYRVQLETFLPRYVAEVCQAECACDGRQLVTAAPVEVPLDTAVVLGMIINEVVTDLGEASCTEPEAPRFTLNSAAADRCSLKISVPRRMIEVEETAVNRAGTLRADLISLLAAQIGATFSTGHNGLYWCEVTFDPLRQRDAGAHIAPSPRSPHRRADTLRGT